MPSCQGGFCSLALPHDGEVGNNHGYTSVFKKQSSLSSKGERRLKRSRQRDRAILHLQWVLTDEEYSSLEESGDLVTLRVHDCECDNKNGYWVDEASIILAKREHRPELARLAFAEFQSSLGDAGDCCGLDGDCAAGGGGYANAKTVPEPGSCGDEGDVIVCSNCYNIYDSLKQARALLKAQERKEEDTAKTFETREIGQQPSTEIVKTVATDKDRAQTKASVNPSRSDDDNIKPKKKKKKRSKRRKRNKKLLEENSKVHILVAESDEVRLSLDKTLFSCQSSPISTFCLSILVRSRQS